MYFCRLNFENRMDLLIPDKTHDEGRQGEALLLEPIPGKNNGRKLYIESYGCAMNFSDSEIVASILTESGFETTGDFTVADVVLINTCSIRENAEQRVRNRLKEFAVAKVKNPGMVVGVLGCMAERLKSKFLEEEKLVDVVVGPDAYRDLPNLIDKVDDGQRAVNVLLSREETYADINPVRLNSNGINAFVSIMRGCDNMCSFCVVPFTRGRERSREPQSIVNECRELFDRGYREVTLLGQNVDSYKWTPAAAPSKSPPVGETSAAHEAGSYRETADPVYYEQLKDFSRDNRNSPTQAENILWQFLRNEQTGFKTRRQHAIGQFIADFVCLQKGLIIEIDGHHHKLNKEADDARTQVLNNYGFEVIRFTNDEVLQNPQQIFQIIKQKLDTTPDRDKTRIYGDSVNATKAPANSASAAKVSPTGGDLEGAWAGCSVNFANLLEMVALISPQLRVRFSTSHPKDITDEVLHTIARYDNICNYIHLPVQSGNSRVLELMNRTYDREWYMNRIDAIRRIIPNCAISTDVITGFCTETEEEHQATLSMMDYVQYYFAYMFMYSERPGTLAAKRYTDDIPDEVKRRRLKEVVAKQQEHSHERLKKLVGSTQKVLIEGFSKKSNNDYSGRSDQNTVVVFPVTESHKPGQYVEVFIDRCTTATLIGAVVD
jgi:tRNA A37 methylthiotransferase MiaB/very-short-patch-repair endonuclease